MELYIKHTKKWLEEVVIGLNLCPFAKLPYQLGRIRFIVELGTDENVLLSKVHSESDYLLTQREEAVATTLIIHPHLLQNFLDYNDFLYEVDRLIVEKELEGEIQVASFHPQYQFAGTMQDDAENYTNRSPYPMIHLLREEMLEEVLGNYPDPEGIPQQNINTMNRLGKEGISAIWKKITHL